MWNRTAPSGVIDSESIVKWCFVGLTGPPWNGCEHRTAIVAIGADVEEHHEGEKRKREISEATIALR